MGGDTEYYLIKHSLLVFLSLIAMWVAHKVDYRYYSKLSRFALWISVPLLLITWKFGTNINEASRWITIPIINQAFQPSDLAKLALLVTLASMLSKRQQSIDDFQARHYSYACVDWSHLWIDRHDEYFHSCIAIWYMYARSFHRSCAGTLLGHVASDRSSVGHTGA